MVVKSYGWPEGAVLQEHSKRKHKILREYFYRYINVRCRNPRQTKFRLAVVDGFAGGGRYACGSAGSPIIIIEELQRALTAINVYRAAQGLARLSIECLLVLNEAEVHVQEILKHNSEPVIAAAKTTCPELFLEVSYICQDFQHAYPIIRQMISDRGFSSVVYNLDQYGHSAVDRTTLVDIMQSSPSAEIFYTFAIKSLLAFLANTEPQLLNAQLRPFGLTAAEVAEESTLMTKQAWLGAAEKAVFDTFGRCAPYVSPFSIHNPNGWRYWLIHFANRSRARQVYNNVLHDNATEQAHYGRSGLNMLSYDPAKEGKLYLFDSKGRESAVLELMIDIPRLIADIGTVHVDEFYRTIYNATPAHSDDIHQAIMNNEDLKVVTQEGGERRSPNTIAASDTIKLKAQRSFFAMFRK